MKGNKRTLLVLLGIAALLCVALFGLLQLLDVLLARNTDPNLTESAAVGIAAHEAGHAVQYAVGYGPMKFRAAIIPVTNIGSTLAFPIFLVGLLLSYYPLAAFGIILFSLTALFQAVTLPVEFNASRRAMEALESCRVLSGDELGGARKVLRAAALTYVAALASALAQILRLVLVMNRHRD